MRPDLYTKAILAIIAFPLTLFVVASINAQSGSAEKSAKKAGPPSQSPSIDAEAKAFAQRYWDKLLRRCPDPPRADSYFYIGVVEGGLCCRSRVEMKGVSFRIQAPFRPVSEADKLNGVTSKSRSVLTAQAYRESSEDTSRIWGSWTEWKSPERSDDVGYILQTVIGIRKVNGSWEIDPGEPSNRLAEHRLAEMPACSGLQDSQ
jgi:hypothetical protein